MSSSPSNSSFDPSGYQLPQQDWVCGHLADGTPCPIGPSTHGKCLANKICQPAYDGTAWHCTRPNAWGGRCQDGPLPDAACPDQKACCPHQPLACQPARSLRNKRRLFTGLAIAASLGFCLIVLGGSSRTLPAPLLDTTFVISPGPLASPHAAIEKGCGACHSAATESTADLLQHSFVQSTGDKQSDRCLQCHTDIGRQSRHAHSVDPDLLQKTTSPRPPDSENPKMTMRQFLARTMVGHRFAATAELACAACHQEHRGADFDLTRLSNEQCQSCHQQTFVSFSHGHPEFQAHRSGIRFNHVRHFEQHYKNYPFLMPDGIARTACSECHRLNADGSSYELTGFQFMCASCHEQQIRDYNMPAPLRLHDFEFLKNGNLDFSNGEKLPPFMKLMLGADGYVTEAIEVLEENTSSEPDDLDDALSTLRNALNNLTKELTEDGPQVVADRLKSVLEDSADDRLVPAFTEALTVSQFFEALSVSRAEWSSEDGQNIENKDSDAREASLGNWELINNRNSLVYRADQHADPLLKAWIDLLASQAELYPEPPETADSSRFDLFLRAAISPEATGRCVKCHTLDRLTDGSLRVNWESQHAHHANRGFTEFVHQPHITLLENRANPQSQGTNREGVCANCHRLKKTVNSDDRPCFLQEDGMPSTDYRHASSIGFRAVRKSDCVNCHQPQLAGDNCLQCHNYHVHGQSLLRR